MTGISLEALGLTNAEIIDRIVDRYVEQLRTEHTWDQDGEKTPIATTFDKEIRKRLTAAIDAKVAEVAEKHVIPRVAEMFESVVLQQTNAWGEKIGKPTTFIEYITARANAYMTEKVDFQGKSKEEAGGFSWSGTQTRVTHMIDKHLHYTIQTAMQNALSDFNKSVTGGLVETVKLKLAEALAGLKVEVKSPR